MSVFASLPRMDRISNQELILTLLRLHLTGSGSGLTITSQAGITAFAGGGQVGATPLTKNYNRVDTVGAVNASVIPSVTATVGFFQMVQNNGANDMVYYPFLGNNFVGFATNIGITIAPGNSVVVFCYTTGELTLI